MTELEEAAVAFVEADALFHGTTFGPERAAARVVLDEAKRVLRDLCGYTERYDAKAFRVLVERKAETTAPLFDEGPVSLHD